MTSKHQSQICKKVCSSLLALVCVCAFLFVLTPSPTHAAATRSALSWNTNCIQVYDGGYFYAPGSTLVTNTASILKIQVHWGCQGWASVNVWTDFAYGVNVSSTETYDCAANCSSGWVNWYGLGGFAYDYANEGVYGTYTLHLEVDPYFGGKSYANNYRVFSPDYSGGGGGNCFRGPC